MVLARLYIAEFGESRKLLVQSWQQHLFPRPPGCECWERGGGLGDRASDHKEGPCSHGPSRWPSPWPFLTAHAPPSPSAVLRCPYPI